MLLEFRIGNYRSIRDEQAFSLAASKDKKLGASLLIPTGLKSVPYALRSAVLYGPNASGKSTLLASLNYMRAVVAESATIIQPSQTYNVQPFKLDSKFVAEPTTFEITFLLDGIRHQYAFSMTQKQFISESLIVFRTSKPTQLFSRQFNVATDSYDYEFSNHLTGPRKVWQESTRANALFLSTAAQLNSETLSPVFKWIVNSIVFIPAGGRISDEFTTAMLSSEEGRKAICNFLTTADISIDDVQAVPRKGITQQLIIGPDGSASSNREEKEMFFPVFRHTTKNGSANFELHEESEGTQRLFGLVAPVLDALKNGWVLVADELDSSLHTLLVRRLISMFYDKGLNKNNAQLIFSTHNTSLLDHSLFRRDQIWFAEKNDDQATCIYPLTDFSPRNQEVWEKGYLNGRYGAIPFFKSLMDSF